MIFFPIMLSRKIIYLIFFLWLFLLDFGVVYFFYLNCLICIFFKKDISISYIQYCYSSSTMGCNMKTEVVWIKICLDFTSALEWRFLICLLFILFYNIWRHFFPVDICSFKSLRKTFWLLLLLLFAIASYFNILSYQHFSLPIIASVDPSFPLLFSVYLSNVIFVIYCFLCFCHVSQLCHFKISNRYFSFAFNVNSYTSGYISCPSIDISLCFVIQAKSITQTLE